MGPRDMQRRDFLKMAAAAGAAGGIGGALPGGGLLPREGVAAPVRPSVQDAEIVLGNGEPPALQFQAYPGGTGSLLEKLWRDSGEAPFTRRPLDVEPWRGPVPASEEELAFLPVHRLSALIRERHVSPTELTEIYLERLKRYDPLLLFAVTILEGRAREEAQQAEADLRAGRWRGPLHGIPWGVKDLFSTRGAPTTWGSADFRDRVIDEDAEVVVRLREAGAVLLAKLSTGEFARGDRWFRGRTRNPWNPEEGSSGSSAGPASATAAGCVAFAIGTETRGSIVSPARRCGISALRPTFGRVSRHGGMVLAWSQDRVGPMCRTVEDCALVFDAIHGSDEKDPASLTTPFRFERSPDLAAVSIGYTADAPASFLATLRELGADPRPLPELPEAAYDALGVESSTAFDFWVAPGGVLTPEPDEGQGEDGRRPGRFRGGRTTLALDYLQSQRRRHVLTRQMAAALEGFDVYVSGSGETALTAQTGNPAVVVPYALSEEGPPQPECATLIGALFADDKALSVAHAFQAATAWHRRRPTLG